MGEDSFLGMIYERLILMKELMSVDGSLYLHCDWRLNSSLRIILDEIFGKDNFKNEIVWQRDAVGRGAKKNSNQWSREIESILYYTKTNQSPFNQIFKEGDELQHTQLKEFRYKESDGRLYKIVTLGDYSEKSRQEFRELGLIHKTSTGQEYKKYYLDEFKLAIGSLWNDIPNLSHGKNPENLQYPTQKPEKLIKRIIESSTQPGDVVADFFAGSGTTAAAAEKMGRKWMISDIGRFAVNTSRKRLIKVQRELKSEGKDFRSFEVLAVGNYSFNDYSQQQEFNETVLFAYKAEVINNSPFTGKKANHYVVVGPLDLPASRDYVDEMVQQAREQKVLELDLLAFEFGMGVVPEAIADANKLGVKLNLKIIPREVFDKKAVADGAVKFSEVGYLDVKIEVKKLEASIKLTDFSIFYSQDSLELDGDNLQKGKSKVVLDNGIIKKITKNKDGIVKIVDIATSWIDWIDYWAIDFNFEDRQELKLVKHDDGKIEQVATGRNIFDNQWQSFKTVSEKIELTSSKYEYPKAGKYKVAVKVIDVFGNDTTRVFDVTVGK